MNVQTCVIQDYSLHGLNAQNAITPKNSSIEMSANSALLKFKMVNGLIGSILDENRVSFKTLFPKLPQIDTEVRSKVEKLLESRERIKGEIDEDGFLKIKHKFYKIYQFLLYQLIIKFKDIILCKNLHLLQILFKNSAKFFGYNKK